MRDGGKGQGGTRGPSDGEIEAALREALKLRNDGRLLDAEMLCRRVLDVAPARVDALTIYGRVLKSQERYAEAERVFRKALKRAPTDPVLHNDLGNVHSAAGRKDEAAKSYRRALANRPGFAEAQYNLANMLRLAGDTAAAIAAYRRYLEIDPDDRAGASLVLASLGEASMPPTQPRAYVVDLFDGYAPTFEAELRDKLGYRGPELMRDAVRPLMPAGPKPAMLDLGCGTGLCALVFKSLVGRIDGIDLAPRMVEASRARGVYASVELAEGVEYLERSRATWGLMTAGDLFIYVGDVLPMLRAAHPRLEEGGLFVATAEAHSGEGFVLRDTLRYAHSRSYIERVAALAGFDVAAWSTGEGRRQKGEAVPFFAFALKKAG